MTKYLQNMSLLACVAIASLIFSSSGLAQDRPRYGILHSATETSSLTYDCKDVSGGLLECRFVQVRVSKVAKPEDRGKALARAKEEFPTFKPDPDCGSYQDMLDILDGKKPSPKPEALTKLASLSKVERDDMKALFAGMAAVCRRPTLDNFIKVMEFAFDKECRTCKVSSSEFSQRFKREGPSTWTVVAEKSGECGVVRLDRFEAEGGGSRPMFFTYFARKAVSNPRGTSMGVPCSVLDEAEQKYDWKGETLFGGKYVGCDYVVFAP